MEDLLNLCEAQQKWKKCFDSGLILILWPFISHEEVNTSTNHHIPDKNYMNLFIY